MRILILCIVVSLSANAQDNKSPIFDIYKEEGVVFQRLHFDINDNSSQSEKKYKKFKRDSGALVAIVNQFESEKKNGSAIRKEFERRFPYLQEKFYSSVALRFALTESRKARLLAN